MDRKSLLYSIAAGVLAALVVLYLRLPDARHLPADQVAASPVPPPAHAPGAPTGTANSMQVASAPRAPEPGPHPGISPDSFGYKAARYAESFQPGLFYEEGMPDFAQSHFFPTQAALTDALADYAKVLQAPADAWSDGMTSRLRTFFAEQAEFSNAHISIACRSVECQFQVIEMTAPSDPPHTGDRRLQMLVQRLAATPWFREQISGLGPGGSTPDGAAVRYMAVRLVRRK